MKLSRVCLTVLAVVPFVAQAAEPGVYANASLSGLSFRLIDLTPDDGIAPTVSFGPSWGVAAVSGVPDLNDWYPTASSVIDLGDTGFKPLTPTSASLPGAIASADGERLSASSFVQSADFIKNLDPNTRTVQSIYPSDIRADVALQPLNNGSSPQNIILGANTGIIVTGMGHIDGQLDPGALKAALDALPNNQETWLGWGHVTAHVNISLAQRTVQVDEAGNIYAQSEVRSGFSLDHDLWENGAFDHSSAFSLQFLNLGNEAGEVSLDIAVSAGSVISSSVDFRDPADIITPPPITPGVPEPGTYLLMGLGLVGLGIARRRAAH